MSKMIAVIHSNMRAAHQDFRDDLISFDRSSGLGMLPGGPVVFVNINNLDRLLGIELRSYQFHNTAYSHKDFGKAHAIAESRVRSLAPLPPEPHHDKER